METDSPNVFHSPNSSESLPQSSSSKGKIRLSEVRYTPSQSKDQGLSTFVLDICQDSLEFPKAKSRLIEFSQMVDGEDKPRQVMMPLFFHAKNSPSHQRHTSLKQINKAKQTISEILENIRDRPQPKSSLKTGESSKKSKTVSFCSQIELSSPDTLQNSVIHLPYDEILEDSLENIGKSTGATSANSIFPDKLDGKVPETTTSTQQNVEFHDESEESHLILVASKEFPFEEEVRTSLALREEEFNEFSTVAYCKSCNKEIVTTVTYEKIKGQGCSEVTEWLLCWVFPACMYKNKRIVHKCPICHYPIVTLH